MCLHPVSWVMHPVENQCSGPPIIQLATGWSDKRELLKWTGLWCLVEVQVYKAKSHFSGLYLKSSLFWSCLSVHSFVSKCVRVFFLSRYAIAHLQTSFHPPLHPGPFKHSHPQDFVNEVRLGSESESYILYQKRG